MGSFRRNVLYSERGNIASCIANRDKNIFRQVDAVGPYSILAAGLFMGGLGYLAMGPIPPLDPSMGTVVVGLCVTGFAGSIPWVSAKGPRIKIG